jgi:predicted Zn finger-like uncharacterized protein
MLKDSIITTCPHCKAQFKVTHGQLKIAHGQVRCGNCLNVFSATEHEEKSDPVNTATHPSDKAPTHSVTNPAEAQQSRTIPAPPDTAPAHQHNNNNTEDETNNRLTDQQLHTKKQPTQRYEVAIKTAAEPNTPIPTLTIEREAIVLSSSPKKAPQKNLLWLLILLLAIIGIVAQYAWFNRAELYWQAPYQNVYRVVCQQIDCHIPPRFKLDKIQNQKLVIAPHDKIEGAISANLILLNSAPFKQSFPALKLTFSDLKGRTIAQRTFQPTSYLNLIDDNAPLMPINQPVQVSLELMLPSTRAINYTVELLAPEQ